MARTGVAGSSAGSVTVTGSATAYAFTGSLQFIRVGKNTYVKGDKAFWDSLVYTTPPSRLEQAVAAKRYPKVVDKWVHFTGKGEMSLEFHLIGLSDP